MSDIKGNVVNVQVSGPASAVKAKKLAKPRKITLGGDLAGSVEFDGSQDVELEAKVLNAQGTAKPDYNQNDEAQPDYIKNRPGGYDVVTPGVTIQWDGNTAGKVQVGVDSGDIFAAYKISDEVLTKEQLIGATADGVLIAEGEITDKTGYVTCTSGGKTLYSFSQTGSVSIGDSYPYVAYISETGTYYYVPKMQTVPANTYIAELVTADVASPVRIPARYLDLTQVEIAISNTAPKTNPSFTGSVSQNRKKGSVIGEYSHTEGYGGTASGGDSHVEGDSCVASGMGSHAEGYKTEARGEYSHAEGKQCLSSGSLSHTEGYACTASGVGSHAEGFENKAVGQSSHAEGDSCIASGKDSHVQGRLNIEDQGEKYAHIVGNGITDSKRSNTHTIDWNGVPWYQGRPQFGGTAQDNGSQTVMANGDKEIILASSTSGSTKKFKITVDDTGTLKVTEVTAS